MRQLPRWVESSIVPHDSIKAFIHGRIAPWAEWTLTNQSIGENCKLTVYKMLLANYAVIGLRASKADIFVLQRNSWNPVAKSDYVDSSNCENILQMGLCQTDIEHLSQTKARTPIDGTQKASFEIFLVAIKSNYFQNESKPYKKRIDVFLRHSDFTFVVLMWTVDKVISLFLLLVFFDSFQAFGSANLHQCISGNLTNGFVLIFQCSY